MLTFAEFQRNALYGPEGFFVSKQRLGRSGDFITSPTLSTVFGQVIATVLDEYWRDMGCPQVFDVVEFGAGDGSLARSILSADMKCSQSLRYTAVDLRPVCLEGVRTAERIPDDVQHCVVLANELFDNMPVSLFEWQPGGWKEVWVDQCGDEFVEVFRDPAADSLQMLKSLVCDPRVGARVPVQFELLHWLEALTCIPNGRLLAFDYGRKTQEMSEVHQAEWLRTYRGHFPGGNPLQRPGSQDITCDVAIDQVLGRFPEMQCVSQADFLRHHGIDSLPVLEGEGVMKSLRERAKKREVEALLDPSGFGGFKVFQWRWPFHSQRQKNT